MSSLSVASSTSTPQAGWTPAANPFQKLAQALQSGDLAGAQQAFALIQQNAPQNASAPTGQAGSRQAAFAALGQALQSGNLTAAQQAFAQLQQAGGHHHHHHGGQEAAAAATGTAATAGNTLNITNNSGTINEIIGGSGSGSSGGSGGAGETINITGNTGTINIIA